MFTYPCIFDEYIHFIWSKYSVPTWNLLLNFSFYTTIQFSTSPSPSWFTRLATNWILQTKLKISFLVFLKNAARDLHLRQIAAKYKLNKCITSLSEDETKVRNISIAVNWNCTHIFSERCSPISNFALRCCSIQHWYNLYTIALNINLYIQKRRMELFYREEYYILAARLLPHTQNAYRIFFIISSQFKIPISSVSPLRRTIDANGVKDQILYPFTLLFYRSKRW